MNEASKKTAMSRKIRDFEIFSLEERKEFFARGFGAEELVDEYFPTLARLAFFRRPFMVKKCTQLSRRDYRLVKKFGKAENFVSLVQ